MLSLDTNKISQQSTEVKSNTNFNGIGHWVIKDSKGRFVDEGCLVKTGVKSKKELSYYSWDSYCQGISGFTIKELAEDMAKSIQERVKGVGLDLKFEVVSIHIKDFNKNGKSSLINI